MILPADHSLVMTNEHVLVQQVAQVHWSDAEQARGSVETSPDTKAWLAWVNEVGGAWSTLEDLADM